LQYVKSLA